MREIPTGGIVTAVCVGEKPGEKKTAVPKGAKLKRDFGFIGDAEAKKESLYQARMLSEESVSAAGGKILPGYYGENILTRGADLSKLEHGAVLRIGDAAAQVTWQAAKLRKYRRYGEEIVMSELFSEHGVFLTILKTSIVRPGDSISVILDCGHF